MRVTPNIGLPIWETKDKYSQAQLNEAFEKIDTEIGNINTILNKLTMVTNSADLINEIKVATNNAKTEKIAIEGYINSGATRGYTKRTPPEVVVTDNIDMTKPLTYFGINSITYTVIGYSIPQSPNNFPANRAGTLITFGMGHYSSSWQEWIPLSSNAIYKRTALSDTTWSNWTKMQYSAV